MAIINTKTLFPAIFVDNHVHVAKHPEYWHADIIERLPDDLKKKIDSFSIRPSYGYFDTSTKQFYSDNEFYGGHLDSTSVRKKPTRISYTEGKPVTKIFMYPSEKNPVKEAYVSPEDVLPAIKNRKTSKVWVGDKDDWHNDIFAKNKVFFGKNIETGYYYNKKYLSPDKIKLDSPKGDYLDSPGLIRAREHKTKLWIGEGMLHFRQYLKENTQVGHGIVKSRGGLHARPSTMLVKLAKAHRSTIEVAKDEKGPWVDAKSIIKVMGLRAAEGSTLHYRALGDDSEKAMSNLKKYFETME